MADLGQSHPDLVRRYQALAADARRRGWAIGVTSATRDRAQQAELYRRRRLPVGHPDRWPASVANPDADGGPSPWGWHWAGSYHMPQADQRSHALDLHWSGCDAGDVERLAATYGLVQTVPGENWHYQWCHRRVIFDAPALVEAAGTAKGRRRMFLWTCAQNDGQQVNYLYADRQVTSLYGLNTVAYSLVMSGVPHGGHLNEVDHNLLLQRLLDNPDPGTGADGSWHAASA